MMKQVLLGLVFLAAAALRPCSSHGSEIVFSSVDEDLQSYSGRALTAGLLGVEDYVMDTTFDGNVDLISFDFNAFFADSNGTLNFSLEPVLNFDWQDAEGNSVANFDATAETNGSFAGYTVQAPTGVSIPQSGQLAIALDPNHPTTLNRTGFWGAQPESTVRGGDAFIGSSPSDPSNLFDFFGEPGNHSFKITVTGQTSVPEPGTLATLALGISGLLFRRRRA